MSPACLRRPARISSSDWGSSYAATPSCCLLPFYLLQPDKKLSLQGWAISQEPPYALHIGRTLVVCPESWYGFCLLSGVHSGIVRKLVLRNGGEVHTAALQNKSHAADSQDPASRAEQAVYGEAAAWAVESKSTLRVDP